jgi:hypothetical protein
MISGEPLEARTFQIWRKTWEKGPSSFFSLQSSPWATSPSIFGSGDISVTQLDASPADGHWILTLITSQPKASPCAEHTTGTLNLALFCLSHRS